RRPDDPAQGHQADAGAARSTALPGLVRLPAVGSLLRRPRWRDSHGGHTIGVVGAGSRGGSRRGAAGPIIGLSPRDRTGDVPFSGHQTLTPPLRDVPSWLVAWAKTPKSSAPIWGTA